MVSWASDGLVAGYSPATNRLEPGIFHLASGGTVDVNGATRMLYALPGGVNPNTYPNRLAMSVSFTFTAGDFADNDGRDLIAGAFMARADQFAAGAVPTPQQILNLGYQNLAWWRPEFASAAPGTYLFNMDGWGSEAFEADKKYWVLMLPCVYRPSWDIPIRPMAGINVNTVGRAISIWANRRPNKPVITAPLTGTAYAAGSSFNFAYSSNDPDQASTADRYDRDLAGVQVAYAPLATPGNPNPTWKTLQFRRADNNALTTTSVYMNQADVLPGDGRIAMLTNLGFPIVIGGPYNPVAGGTAALPAGEWQIKVRTADYGNPYPTLPNTVGGKYPGNWSMNNVDDRNISDWSDPIRVSVFQQVPPALPLSPRDAIAVPEDQTVRLSWLFRDTGLDFAGDPYDQYWRWLRIRRVGEEAWTSLLDNQGGYIPPGGIGGKGTETFFDIPPGTLLGAPEGYVGPVGPSQYVADPSFESGAIGGWTAQSVAGIDFVNVPITNLVGVAGSTTHTGTRCIRPNGGVGSGSITMSWSGFLNGVTINPGHNTIQYSVWVRVNAEIDYVTLVLGWADVSGNTVGSEIEGTKTPTVRVDHPGDAWTTQWIQITTPPIKRPPTGVHPVVGLGALKLGDTLTPPAEWIRVDDVSLMGSWVEPEVEPWSIEATTEYEWSVKTGDSGFEVSEWSEPVSFWSVEAGASGPIKPIPDETIKGATLGCGHNRVFVYRRGGKVRVGELKGITHVDWNRARDDISISKVVVEDWDVDCGKLLSELQTWAYELVIIRENGYTSDRVWEGPITLLTYEDGKVTIQAKDVMGYAYRRIIKQTVSDVGVGDTVVNRAMKVLQNAFAPDDPNVLAYLTKIPNATDAKQYRTIPAYSRTAFEEVDDMAANAGLDYTCVGRSILLWGTKSRIGTLPEFKDADLGAAPIVSEYGMSMANNYSVSDGNGIHGEANRLNEDGEDPIYGLVEMLSSTWATDAPEDTGTYTQEGIATIIESFEESAERSIADRYPPPVVVRVPDNTTLSPDTVLSIQQLVPGSVVPLRSTSTLRSVKADQKLDSIHVTEESGNETITITLSPFSRDDAAIPEGGEEV